MPSPYRAIFATPGTKGFTAAGLLGRMPLSMVGIGVLTMITELGGSYGLAGALTGTIALSAAAVGPQVSRLVDQYGQRRVLRPATLVAAAAVTGLLIAAANGWPSWTLFPFAVVAGCVPSVGSMVRARWTALFRDTPSCTRPTRSSPSSTSSASSSARRWPRPSRPAGSPRPARWWPSSAC